MQLLVHFDTENFVRRMSKETTWNCANHHRDWCIGILELCGKSSTVELDLIEHWIFSIFNRHLCVWRKSSANFSISNLRLHCKWEKGERNFLLLLSESSNRRKTFVWFNSLHYQTFMNYPKWFKCWMQTWTEQIKTKQQLLFYRSIRGFDFILLTLAECLISLLNRIVHSWTVLNETTRESVPAWAPWIKRLADGLQYNSSGAELRLISNWIINPKCKLKEVHKHGKTYA